MKTCCVVLIFTSFLGEKEHFFLSDCSLVNCLFLFLAFFHLQDGGYYLSCGLVRQLICIFRILALCQICCR